MRRLTLVIVACVVAVGGCQLFVSDYSVGDASEESRGSSSGIDSGGSSGSSGAGGSDGSRDSTESGAAPITVDLTPKGATLNSPGTMDTQAVGDEVSFSSAMSIAGMDFYGAFGTTDTVDVHVWDVTTQSVVATGSTITGNGGTSTWYHSNISFVPVAGRLYVVGGYTTHGYPGETWSNVTHPYTVDNVTVQAGCLFNAGDAAPAVPLCVTGPGSGISMRIVEQ